MLVELKSKSNKNILPKFKSSKSFIVYLNSILKEYYDENITEEYKIIPLLINNKPGKNITPHNENNFVFYRRGVKNEGTYYIKRDFEKILKQ